MAGKLKLASSWLNSVLNELISAQNLPKNCYGGGCKHQCKASPSSTSISSLNRSDWAVLKCDLSENGAEIFDIDEGTAFLAGELALKNERRSIGDTLIAGTALVTEACHVVTDDPHFHELGLRTKWILGP